MLRMIRQMIFCVQYRFSELRDVGELTKGARRQHRRPQMGQQGERYGSARVA